MDAQGVHCEVFFTCGLPFETKEDLEGMAEYRRRLKKKHKRMHFKASVIEIKPGSNMSGIRRSLASSWSALASPITTVTIASLFRITGLKWATRAAIVPITRKSRHLYAIISARDLMPGGPLRLFAIPLRLWKVGVFRALIKFLRSTKRTKFEGDVARFAGQEGPGADGSFSRKPRKIFR